MLSLLSLASETNWQLEMDMDMGGGAALLEVGCLSLACLFRSQFKVREGFAGKR